MFYIPMGVLLVCVAMQQSLFVSGLFWEFLTIIVSADRLISFSLIDRWTIRLGPFSHGPFKQPAGCFSLSCTHSAIQTQILTSISKWLPQAHFFKNVSNCSLRWISYVWPADCSYLRTKKSLTLFFSPKLHQGIRSSFPLSPNKSQYKGLHFAGEKGYKLQYILFICCQVQTAQYQPNFGRFKSRRTSVQEL